MHWATQLYFSECEPLTPKKDARHRGVGKAGAMGYKTVSESSPKVTKPTPPPQSRMAKYISAFQRYVLDLCFLILLICARLVSLTPDTPLDEADKDAIGSELQRTEAEFEEDAGDDDPGKTMPSI